MSDTDKRDNPAGKKSIDNVDKDNVDIALFEQDNMDSANEENENENENENDNDNKSKSNENEERTTEQEKPDTEEHGHDSNKQDTDEAVATHVAAAVENERSSENDSIIQTAAAANSSRQHLEPVDSVKKILVDEYGLAIISCIRCRERKVKCSRELPSCGVCAKRGQECSYPTTKRTRSTIKREGRTLASHGRTFGEPDEEEISAATMRELVNSHNADLIMAENSATNASEVAAAAIAAGSGTSSRGSAQNSNVQYSQSMNQHYAHAVDHGKIKKVKINTAKVINAIYAKHPLVYLANIDLKNTVSSPNIIVLDSLSQHGLASKTNKTALETELIYNTDFQPFSINPLTKFDGTKDATSNHQPEKTKKFKFSHDLLRKLNHIELSGKDTTQHEVLEHIISTITLEMHNPDATDADPDYGVHTFFKYCLHTRDFNLLDNILFELKDHQSTAHPHILKIFGKIMAITFYLSKNDIESSHILTSYNLLQSVVNEIQLIKFYQNDSYQMKKLWEFITLYDFIISQLLLNRTMLTKNVKCPLNLNFPEYVSILNKVPLQSSSFPPDLQDIINLDLQLENLLKNSSTPKLNKLILVATKIYSIFSSSFSNAYSAISLQNSIQLFLNLLLQDFNILSPQSNMYKFYFPVFAQVFQAISLSLSTQLISISNAKELSTRTSIINILDLLQIVLGHLHLTSSLPSYLFKILKSLNENFLPLIEEPQKSNGALHEWNEETDEDTPKIIRALRENEAFKDVVFYYSQKPEKFWEHLSF